PALGQAGLLATDAANKAVGFDGVNDMAQAPSAASLDLTSSFSLEAWIRPAALPTAGAFASVVTKPESYSLQFNGPLLEFTVIQRSEERRVGKEGETRGPGGKYKENVAYELAKQRVDVNGDQVASS